MRGGGRDHPEVEDSGRAHRLAYRHARGSNRRHQSADQAHAQGPNDSHQRQGRRDRQMKLKSERTRRTAVEIVSKNTTARRRLQWMLPGEVQSGGIRNENNSDRIRDAMVTGL